MDQNCNCNTSSDCYTHDNLTWDKHVIITGNSLCQNKTTQTGMNCLHEVTRAHRTHSDLCCAFLYIIAQNLRKIFIHTVWPVQVTQCIGKEVPVCSGELYISMIITQNHIILFRFIGRKLRLEFYLFVTWNCKLLQDKLTGTHFVFYCNNNKHLFTY